MNSGKKKVYFIYQWEQKWLNTEYIRVKKGNAGWTAEMREAYGRKKESIQENITKECGWGSQRKEEEQVKVLE